MVSGREVHRVWSWATLVVASIGAVLLFAATERRYFEYASWTREIRASLETASLLQENKITVLRAVIVVQSPKVGFGSTVERVEFTLDRGGRHLGYFFTLPGEMVVDPVAGAGAGARTRITVTKEAPRELVAGVLAAEEARPAGEADGESVGVRFAGDVVLEVALPRGGRLLRVPVKGEVKVGDGA